MSLFHLMPRYFATCTKVKKLRVRLIQLMLRYFATCSNLNKAQGESYLFDAEIICYL